MLKKPIYMPVIGGTYFLCSLVLVVVTIIYDWQEGSQGICILCRIQRIPYYVICILTAFIFFIRGNRISRFVYACCFFCLIITLMVSIFHILVIHKVVSVPGICKPQPLQIVLLDNGHYSIQPNLQKYGSCDQAQTFLNIALPYWNVFYSLFIIFTVVLYVQRIKKNNYVSSS
ncbi:MAG: hypothetical protein P857_312 [Candidatus Xenolissoclinum pacificiensis L6]|uniref:Disulfide bond formation protein B n=1 Tax=Candidatus Xenolissoclinum pacificiensis L6 TaxID=1401685 RepID=W2V166_9RICK|nr:MAG: hypothetical protein P857_312 [Candidatus Xenolissoclinum pacificiensis L6]